jgi:SSS family solute:Na+ symporter/sodium/pantothenate symporter
VFDLLAASSPPLQVGYGAIAALIVFILASMWIGIIANRATQEGSFLKGFFLGNRGLGAWALALTATVQSGGTFMGFPSLVYTHGWSVALWIASYMVVPITGFGILGKRLAQLSRRTGAITIPDLFRERFGSPNLGLVASLFIMFYMSFMMVAQFKAGALVMKLAWPGNTSLALSEDLPPPHRSQPQKRPPRRRPRPRPPSRIPPRRKSRRTTSTSLIMSAWRFSRSPWWAIHCSAAFWPRCGLTCFRA